MLNFKDKIILLVSFIIYTSFLVAQPRAIPIAFEDNYRGESNRTIKSAQVKTKRMYYKFNGGSESNILYYDFEYNRKGFLVNQKWYDLLSKKEMYSAYYEYDKDDVLTSCTERLWGEAVQTFNVLSPDGSISYEFGGLIPQDKDSNTVIKSIYKRDSLGGFSAKKYFSDGSFYKEEMRSFWAYRKQLYEKLYINKDKSIEYVFSDLYYVADTIYKSVDTLNIRIKTKKTNIACYDILKIRHNNEFIITDIDRIFEKLKLHFSYQNSFMLNDGTRRSEILSITYLSYNVVPERLLLLHKFQSMDGSRIPLNDRIELNEITDLNDVDYLNNVGGCIYYTRFKNGYLSDESHYAIGFDKVEKLEDIYYSSHNLIAEKVHYPSSFNLERYEDLFRYSRKEDVIEIYAYEYFD